MGQGIHQIVGKHTDGDTGLGHGLRYGPGYGQGNESVYRLGSRLRYALWMGYDMYQNMDQATDYDVGQKIDWDTDQDRHWDRVQDMYQDMDQAMDQDVDCDRLGYWLAYRLG